MSEDLKKCIKTLDLIHKDMEKDVKRFDGAPLNGRTVAEIHGNLAAAISGLAITLKRVIKETNN